MPNKAALIILDGFAITPNTEGNAVLNSDIPFIKDTISSYPKTLLKASSQEVGLPWGEAGNSEVGHTTIGLGRVILQDLPQIDKAFQSGQITDKNSIKFALDAAKANRRVHLIGMASDGAVHGHIQHLINFSELFLEKSITPIVHLISDGRDAPEKSLKKYLSRLLEISGVKVGSISGRYFTMDRDKNWDRTEKAYQAILGKNKIDINLSKYISSQYEEDISDEFIEPVSFIDESEIDIENDPIIFCNYRADRAIQITRAFSDKKFEDFNRASRANNFITMTTYEDNIPCKVIFSNVDLNDENTNPLANPLSQIISENNLRQLHIAETEKFAHVTYFFSGGIKDEYKGQENKIIPSKKVKSYEQFPQMRAPEITKELQRSAASGYDFIVCNYANGDMVGHTGNFAKTIESLEILDQNLSLAVDTLTDNNYEVFITADHGNADEMIDLNSKKPSKEHSLNPVFFVHINSKNKAKHMDFEHFLESQPIGIISDIGPSILDVMGIEKGTEMTGVSLMESLK